MAMLGERLRRSQQLGGAAGESKAPAAQKLRRTILAVAAHQLRLVIEHVQVRRRTGHVQVDDALGPPWKMRPPRRHRIDLRALGSGNLVSLKKGKSQATNANRAIPKEMAPGS